MKLVLSLLTGVILSMPTCKNEKTQKSDIPVAAEEEKMEGKKWIVDELIHNTNCTNSHYIRGVKNTTDVNYDNMYFTFKKNGTGTHTDQYGQTHRVTWKFDKSDRRTIYLTVHLTSDIDFVWRMVEISDNKIYATTAIQQPGTDILESFRLIPGK